MIRTIKLMAIAFIFSGLASCDKNDPDPNSLNCTTPTIAGNYDLGTALTASNTVTFPVTVGTTGSYTITSNTVNGMTFSGTGNFTSTGTQNAVLTGTGTPTNSGVQNFTVTYNGSTCNFSVTVSPNMTFKAILTGANEVPANNSTGSGTATLIFNNDTKIFTISTTYSGLTGTATAAHIHKGPPTCVCPVVFPFTNAAVSPIVYTSAALTAAQETDLKTGAYYVNVHTAAFPLGEIRGILVQQ
ncbi:MAG TPA: CHRD domain-containing protein [Chitinophagaceae bacterium]|nr:CHRD domain-containing protein [Chitinophagaceae bacterium]